MLQRWPYFSSEVVSHFQVDGYTHLTGQSQMDDNVREGRLSKFTNLVGNRKTIETHKEVL